MSTRFVRRGVSKYLFSPTCANIQAPTRAEITGATDLSQEIADLSGWMLENQAASTPDMGSTFEKSIPGLDSAADSSFTFYEDADSEELETLLPKGQEGFVFILRKGDKPTSKSMDVFPVRVSSFSGEHSNGNDAARDVANFTITDEPALSRTIPAAA